MTPDDARLMRVAAHALGHLADENRALVVERDRLRDAYRAARDEGVRLRRKVAELEAFLAVVGGQWNHPSRRDET